MRNIYIYFWVKYNIFTSFIKCSYLFCYLANQFSSVENRAQLIKLEGKICGGFALNNH